MLSKLGGATVANQAGAMKDKMMGRKSMSRPTRRKSTPRRKALLSALGGAYRGQ